MTPPEQNGQRSVNDWLIHIDSKLTAIDDKLDKKADKDDLDKLEEDHSKLKVKVYSALASLTGAGGLMSWLIKS